jgi:hypothetical protein
MAGVLEHPAELFRPEVRHRVVYLAAAQDVRREHFRGVQRRIPVLYSQAFAEPHGLERRAVPRGVDSRERRAQAGVDGDAVVERQARARQPAHGRPDADRRHDLVGGQPGSSGQREAAPLHRLHGGACPQLDSGSLVPGSGMGPGFGAEGGGERGRPGLDDRDQAACRRGRGRQFGADPAGADDRETQSWPEQAAQRQGVVQGPQEPLRPWTRKRRGHGARRQHEAVEGVLTAIGDEG